MNKMEFLFWHLVETNVVPYGGVTLNPDGSFVIDVTLYNLTQSDYIALLDFQASVLGKSVENSGVFLAPNFDIHEKTLYAHKRTSEYYEDPSVPFSDEEVISIETFFNNRDNIDPNDLIAVYLGIRIPAPTRVIDINAYKDALNYLYHIAKTGGVNMSNTQYEELFTQEDEFIQMLITAINNKDDASFSIYFNEEMEENIMLFSVSTKWYDNVVSYLYNNGILYQTDEDEHFYAHRPFLFEDSEGFMIKGNRSSRKFLQIDTIAVGDNFFSEIGHFLINN